MPSKLSSDHRMLSVLPAFQEILVFLISNTSVVMEDLSETWKSKHVFKRFADLVLKCLNL